MSGGIINYTASSKIQSCILYLAATLLAVKCNKCQAIVGYIKKKEEAELDHSGCYLLAIVCQVHSKNQARSQSAESVASVRYVDTWPSMVRGCIYEVSNWQVPIPIPIPSPYHSLFPFHCYYYFFQPGGANKTQCSSHKIHFWGCILYLMAARPFSLYPFSISCLFLQWLSFCCLACVVFYERTSCLRNRFNLAITILIL